MPSKRATCTQDCAAAFRASTPTAGFNETEGEGTLANGTHTQKSQAVDSKPQFPCEPISTRFGRNETQRLQRPKSGLAAVSEVRSVTANPSEFKRKFCAQAPLLWVRNLMLAEGRELRSNLLLWMPLGLQGKSDGLDA
jgi:hypothetical protein